MTVHDSHFCIFFPSVIRSLYIPLDNRRRSGGGRPPVITLAHVSSAGGAFFGRERTRRNKNKSDPTPSDPKHPCPRCHQALLGSTFATVVIFRSCGRHITEHARVNRSTPVITSLAPGVWTFSLPGCIWSTQFSYLAHPGISESLAVRHTGCEPIQDLISHRIKHTLEPPGTKRTHTNSAYAIW